MGMNKVITNIMDERANKTSPNVNDKSNKISVLNPS
jgi:hypothetical protein